MKLAAPRRFSGSGARVTVLEANLFLSFIAEGRCTDVQARLDFLFLNRSFNAAYW
jgi:hypothetical protein